MISEPAPPITAPALTASEIMALPIGAEVVVAVDGQPPVRARVQAVEDDRLILMPIPQPAATPIADRYYWLGANGQEAKR